MKKTLKITLVTIISVLSLSTMLFIVNLLNKANIYNGVSIENIDVGSLSKYDAEENLKDRLDDYIENKEIEFIYEDYTKKFKYKDLGIGYDYEKSVEEAHRIGRNGNIFFRLKDIIDVSFNDKNINLKFKKDKEKLDHIVKKIEKDIFIAKKDATIRYSRGKFIVTEDVLGRNINSENLKKDIDSAIDTIDIIKIPVEIDKAKITKAELDKVKDEIATYSTKFTLKDSNRVHNIKRAASSIDNKLLLSGETFSFNKATGPRSLKAGYKEAAVIVDGEFVPGEGGGVCQVSSTLYNTLLSSGVNITERHKHSLPVLYVPIGKDATVAYDVLDLKFENKYESPVYIKTYVNNNILTIKMYGDKNSKLK